MFFLESKERRLVEISNMLIELLFDGEGVFLGFLKSKDDLFQSPSKMLAQRLVWIPIQHASLNDLFKSPSNMLHSTNKPFPSKGNFNNE